MLKLHFKIGSGPGQPGMVVRKRKPPVVGDVLEIKTHPYAKYQKPIRIRITEIRDMGENFPSLYLAERF